MNEGLKLLGEIVKGRREEKRITLREVENAISIRSIYLQAIEEGNVDKLISPAYAMGFLRQYASFLGFDLEKLSHEYPEIFRLSGEKQEFSYGIGTLERRGAPPSAGRFSTQLLWGGAFAALLLVGWYMARWMGLL